MQPAIVALHLLLRRPDVAEVDLLALVVLRQRLVHEVDVHRAGQGVGDDQRRAGEIVGLHVRVDAAFEIAVAREHRRDDQVAFSTALAIGSGSGPLLPMQVMQP